MTRPIDPIETLATLFERISSITQPGDVVDDTGRPLKKLRVIRTLADAGVEIARQIQERTST